MNKPVSLAAQNSFEARFTTAEFVHMADIGAFDDMKVELVDGRLERMNPPMGAHSSRQSMVVGSLWPIARAAGIGLLGEIGIDLGNDRVFVCDAALVRRSVTEHRLIVPSETLLVIEIAETTIARDLGTKRIAYARADIPQYWVIDSARSVVHVFAAPEDGEFSAHTTVRFGTPLAVPGTDATITLD